MSRLALPFVAAVLAAPEDDGPRLACADELAARGDPWALLIRLQCERARLPADSPRAREIFAEEEAWQEAHGAELRADLGVAACAHELVRGFVEHLALTGEDDARAVTSSLGPHPVRRLHISGPELDGTPDEDVLRALVAWLDHTAVESLSVTLDLTSGNLVTASPNLFPSILASPRAAALRRLSLGGELTGSDELVMIAETGLLPELRSLAFTSGSAGANVGLRRVITDPRAPRLDSLDLSSYLVDTAWDTGGVPPGLFTEPRQRLTHLALGLGAPLDAEAWIRSPVFDALASLHLRLDCGEPPAEEPFERLLRSAPLARISRVTVFGWDGQGWDAERIAALGLSNVRWEEPADEWAWMHAQAW